MKKIFLISFLLVFSHWSFGFSETEIESLESSGTKNFSESSWRTELGFSLKRNLHVETRFQSNFIPQQPKLSKKFCDPSKEGSLCDLSNLYYGLDFTLYYSLGKITEKSYKFLKSTELFLSSNITSNFTGGKCASLADYDVNQFSDYIKCSLGNIVGGLTSPIYKKSDLFAFLNVSAVLLPLSKLSQDTGHVSSFDTAISLLYFLKKESQWSMALSSAHTLAYNYFKKETANNLSYNTPIDTGQSLSLIYKQSSNKYLPSNSSLSGAYSLGINTYKTGKKDCDYKFNVLACGTRSHYLTLGANSSWKLKKRAYLKISAVWRDLIYSNNPRCDTDDNKFCGKKTKKTSFKLYKWNFNMRFSYAF